MATNGEVNLTPVFKKIDEYFEDLNKRIKKLERKMDIYKGLAETIEKDKELFQKLADYDNDKTRNYICPRCGEAARDHI